MSRLEHFPARFRTRVRLSSAPGGCWTWAGRHIGNGYGAFEGGDTHGQYAHRAAWVMRYGPVPSGARVAHRCGNRLCVRPEHLLLIPARRDQPGRRGSGASNSNAHLTEQDVARIRDAVFRGERQVDVAKRHGISQPQVSAIVTRRLWRHVA